MNTLKELCKQITISNKYLGIGQIPGDKTCSNKSKYNVRLSYKSRTMVVDFYMPLNGNEPTAENVLESLFLEFVDANMTYKEYSKEMGGDISIKVFNLANRNSTNLRKLLDDDFDKFRDAEV